MKDLREFDYKKAVQAINYLAEKEGGKIDKMKLIKLIYLAERYHLRKYGRPITNDTYLAMEYGAVGSSIKDIVGFTDFLPKLELEYTSKYLAEKAQNGIMSIKEADTDVFSDSDIEALDFSYRNFGDIPPFELVKLVHKYPEWKKFKVALNSKQVSREHMNYLDFFSDPDSVEDDKFRLPKEDLDSSKEIFEESYRIGAFWTK